MEARDAAPVPVAPTPTRRREAAAGKDRRQCHATLDTSGQMQAMLMVFRFTFPAKVPA
jgi:hypothetical protein